MNLQQSDGTFFSLGCVVVQNLSLFIFYSFINCTILCEMFFSVHQSRLSLSFFFSFLIKNKRKIDNTKYHRESISCCKGPGSVLTHSSAEMSATPDLIDSQHQSTDTVYATDETPVFLFLFLSVSQSWLLFQLLISEQHFTLWLLLCTSSNRSIHLISVRTDWERFPEDSRAAAA